MHVGIVTPDIHGWHTGNRVTAQRWAGFLRELGHEGSIETVWRGQDWDALIAVHARRSHPSIVAFDEEHPERPLVVALAGTDLYVDYPAGDEDVRDALARADQLIALQSRALEVLPPDLAARTHVILQSARPPSDPAPRPQDAFDVAVIGHLRRVKLPLLTAAASRRLPPDSRVRVLHVGGALDHDLGDRATDEMRENRRYTWMGALDPTETLRLLSGCHLLSLTSRSEGGGNVLGEAIVCGVPVVASRMDGAVGVLGADYPGLFPVGDVDALAELLSRAEREQAFYATLQSACDALRPRFTPETERAALDALVGSWRDSSLPPR